MSSKPTKTRYPTVPRETGKPNSELSITRLALLRCARGLSVYALCQEAGVGRWVLTYMEQGKLPPPWQALEASHKLNEYFHTDYWGEDWIDQLPLGSALGLMDQDHSYLHRRKDQQNRYVVSQKPSEKGLTESQVKLIRDNLDRITARDPWIFKDTPFLRALAKARQTDDMLWLEARSAARGGWTLRLEKAVTQAGRKRKTGRGSKDVQDRLG